MLKYWHEHWRTPMFKQYWKEIICLLVVKAILLTGLWYVSFSKPPKLDDQAAGQHILGQ